MINNRMFIFHATDYHCYPLGGTIGTIKNYLKYTKYQCVLVGITNDPYTKIGTWQNIEIDGRYYDFLPVARARKGIIPDKLLLFAGIILCMRRIMEKCNDKVLNAMLFVNTECFLPIKYLLGRKRELNVFYKMTVAVNPLITSGRPITRIKLLQEMYYKVFIRSLLFGSSIIFSINKQCRQFCEKALLRDEDRKKIADVRHYVDYDYLLQLFKKTESTLSKDRKTLIFWGRLAAVKGLDLIIKSVWQLSEDGFDVDLLIIGDGEERSRLENLVKELKLIDRIRFLGRRNIKEIAALSKNADLFVMSSLSEGIPTSMLEALTFGLPILSTDVGGIYTLVYEGVNAYLIRKRDVNTYASGIKNALQLNREKAANYGQNLVKNHFSAQCVVKKMDHFMILAMEKKLK